MNIGGTSRQSFYSPHACGNDSPPDDEKEARVQALSSSLQQHLPDAPIGKIIELAQFVIFSLPSLLEQGKVEFLRKPCHLLCTIRCDPETNQIFFFPKGQKTVSGTYRAVKTALCLLPNQELIRIKKMAPKKPQQKFHDHLAHDLCIFTDPSFYNAKGLPKMHALLSYPWKHLDGREDVNHEDGSVTKEKCCLMMEPFKGGVRDLVKGIQEGKITPLSFRERASIIRQMVESVHTLHAHVDEEGVLDPIAHYDIKPANFLYRIEDNRLRKFVVTICDFGLHCHVYETPEGGDIRTWYIDVHHLYPYALGTAPELLEETPISYDYLKADIWALGLACLMLYGLDEEASWVNNLKKARRYHANMPLARSMARRKVLAKRNELLEKAELLFFRERPLIRVIEMMLEPNPTYRPSIQVVKQKIEDIVIGSVYSEEGVL